MAAVPSIGRAHGIEGAPAPEADLTRALYEQYANQIFRYCLHQLGSREEAEDATQSTFLNAFRGIKRGIVPELESAWLFKIAHNVCLSRRRSSWRRGKVESPADFDVVEELAPAPSRRADELIGLQDVLEQMPEQQRRAILLREWQGLSYREIAEELELSQAAVETLIFRARRSLAQGLEQPVAPKKRRRALAGALGNLLSAGQSFLFGGGAAVKVAATVAAVSATTVVATAPTQKHAPTPPKQPAGAAWHDEVAPARAGGTSDVATTPGAGGVQRPAAPKHSAAAPVHVRAKKTAPLVAPAAAAPAVEPPTPAAPPQQPVVVEPAATPEPPAAKTEAPGQTKKADEQQSAKADAPGQVKKADDQPSAKREAPGQVKQQDDPAPPAAAEPHGNPDAPGQARRNEAVEPAPAAVPPQGTAEPGSSGNGKPDKQDRPKK